MSEQFARPASELAIPRVGTLEVAAAPSGGQGLALDETGGIPSLVAARVLPWLIDINVFPTAVSHTQWNTVATDASSIYGRFKDTIPIAQNNEINWDVVLGAGTWSIELIHITISTAGIYTIQLDEATVGTIDGYTAATTYDVRTTVSGIVVGASGKKRLKLLMATKNASSSNYRGLLTAVQLRRTA